jgi:hypothetical protein
MVYFKYSHLLYLMRLDELYLSSYLKFI